MNTIFYLSLDTETSGLNGPLDEAGNIQGAKHNLLLQVAGKVLDANLNELGAFDYMVEHKGVNFVEKCEPGNYEFHNKNGFWHVYDQKNKTPLHTVTARIVEFHLPNIIREFDENILKEYGGKIPDYKYDNSFKLILLGKSIAFDRDFINNQMPTLARKLSHQLADVSSIRTLMYPIKTIPNKISEAESTHIAMDDVDAAIRDAKVLSEYIRLTMPKGKWKTLEEAVNHLK